jgi:hypothetical protein
MNKNSTILYFADTNDIVIMKKIKNKVYFYGRDFEKLPYCGDYYSNIKFDRNVIILGKL